eukprot:516134-Rhodomonas_salina.2
MVLCEPSADIGPCHPCPLWSYACTTQARHSPMHALRLVRYGPTRGTDGGDAAGTRWTWAKRRCYWPTPLIRYRPMPLLRYRPTHLLRGARY